MPTTAVKSTEPNRILSIDFFRGFTMFLLISGYGALFDMNSNNEFVAAIGRQMDHADWEGLRAWDLIQPFFMFIVGASMPFAFSKRWARGDSWNSTFRSALKRSLILLFLGWLIGSSETASSFTNVLAQLAVTYFIAFLLMRKPIIWQLVASVLLIVASDTIYHVWPVDGFNQPFTADHNFGSWFDIFLTGGLSDDRWVAFNAIPTTAHTIWGVIAGTILLKEWPARRKMFLLLIAGVTGIVLGYILGLYIPIIKRVCTSSFIVVSGGWAITALALCYWCIDVMQQKKGVMFFAIVGMNPLFIYLFSHSGGKKMLEEFIKPLVYRLLHWAGDDVLHVTMIIIISILLWYICYFLYKRKIFIRI